MKGVLGLVVIVLYTLQHEEIAQFSKLTIWRISVCVTVANVLRLLFEYLYS